jgi:hypothetical protein
MAKAVRKVDHYSATIPNKVVEGARILGKLHNAGVNLIALWAYRSGAGRARVEFIPENGAAFVAAAKRAKLKLSKKSTAFHIQGGDRPGAVAEVLAKLAAARINVAAVQAVCGGMGRYGAIVFLPQAAVRKATAALGGR